jgi:hypothetical protein
VSMMAAMIAEAVLCLPKRPQPVLGAGGAAA